MKTHAPKTTFSLASVLCNTLGHDYIVTRKVTNHISEYKCAQCGREVTNTMAPGGKLEILTYKHRQINSSLATFFEKKNKRVLAH